MDSYKVGKPVHELPLRARRWGENAPVIAQAMKLPEGEWLPVTFPNAMAAKNSNLCRNAYNYGLSARRVDATLYICKRPGVVNGEG